MSATSASETTDAADAADAGTTDGRAADASATAGDAETAATAEGTSPDPAADELNDKQGRILSYLRERAGETTYFKSRLIAEELGLSAKEVGANMAAVADAAADLDVEKWGYSSGTTWMVTR